MIRNVRAYATFWLVGIQVVIPFVLYGQAELRSLIPPSPTVAALGEYGDVPVSTYIGSPGISIPIHEISTGDFSMPIGLTYHSSGIRVEEISSWVGLGWSLNAGGVITRSIRGYPDETGYMNASVKVSDIMEMTHVDRDDYLRDALHHTRMDLEPDLYYYNFAGRSGKFYYNQETDEIVSLPRDAIEFDKEYFESTGHWKVVAEDGTQFYFELSEENISTTECNGSGGSPSPGAGTGWFLTRIITPLKKKQITLGYSPVNYTITNIGQHTKYLAVSGSGGPDGSSCLFDDQICNSKSEYIGYRLSSITYDRGSVEFVASTSRLDVLGDMALDSIKVFSVGSENPTKIFTLGYDYFNSDRIDDGLAAQELAVLVRLMLRTVHQSSVEGNTIPPYEFEYTEQVNFKTLPSRMSYAQDAWGYYNGADGNEDLVPEIRQGLRLIPGADRVTDHRYASLGLLKKVTYPTGGYTELEYEAHRVADYIPYSENIPLVYQAFYLDPADTCAGYGGSAVFCDSVTIGNSRTGGAFVNIRIEGIQNCTYCPEATTCAVMYLQGENVYLPITCEVDDLYLPRGNYRVTADFSNNSDPTVYEEFVIMIDWYERDEDYVFTGESFVGGARIANTKSYGDNNQPISKYYKYYNGGLSQMDLSFEYGMTCGQYSTYLVRTSTSNYPLSGTQGSHIGYSKVEILSDSLGLVGKTVMSYTSPRDFSDEYSAASTGIPSFGAGGGPQEYPFAPPASADYLRGLLRLEEFYDGGNTLVKSVEHKYEPIDGDQEEQSNILFDEAYGLKLAPKNLGVLASGQLSYAVYTHYPIRSHWVRKSQQIEKNYSNGQLLESNTWFHYDNEDHMQPTRVTQVASNGDSLVTYNSYPLDITAHYLYHPETKALHQLKLNGYKSTIIHQVNTVKKENGEEYVNAAVFNKYSEDSLLIKKVYVYEADEPQLLSEYQLPIGNASGKFDLDEGLKHRITFQKYDANGELLEQSKAGDYIVSYKWGYSGTQLIAEAHNCSSTKFFYTSFEDIETNVTTDGSVTGYKSYDTNLAISMPGTGTYILTYWKKVGSNPWELVEEIVSTSQSIGGAGILIDEVRLYPVDARLTTYAYDHNLRISSATDPNNVVTYYDYDDFGRLKTIRDSSKNTLKEFIYNYKNQ